MKNIVFIIIAILLLEWFVPFFTNNVSAANTITIQSTARQVSPAMLEQSASVIEARLKDFSAEHFDISVIPTTKQIKVVFAEGWDLKVAEKLMTQKGSLGFYETYDREHLNGILKGDQSLYSLLSNQSPENSFGLIGCTAITEAEKVNSYINKLELDRTCKFAWCLNAGQSDVCLYALRSDMENGAPMTGKDVGRVKCAVDNSSGSSYIEIRFKEASVALWSDLTKRNIGQTIAIVLDDMVLSAPMVREAISGGLCQITGNFTADEVRTMAALANNGELPVEFEMVK